MLADKSDSSIQTLIRKAGCVTKRTNGNLAEQDSAQPLVKKLQVDKHRRQDGATIFCILVSTSRILARWVRG